MAQILTFLGQERAGCAVASAAAARRLAQQDQRVLWVTQDTSPLPTQLWEMPLTSTPQAIAPQLWGLQLTSTGLLEQSWETVKSLEAQYLRNPLLKQVYGQELVVLPGMDEALALNTLRELDGSGEYDCIVFDGRLGQTTLRMWGLPDGLDWYIRRFQEVVQASELAQALTPFIQPIASTILTIGGNSETLQQPLQQARSFLTAGRSAVQTPERVLGFLVTSANDLDVAATRYLWGSAQQIGLTIAGVMATDSSAADRLQTAFAPLPIHPLPTLQGQNWEPLVAAVPDLPSAIAQAPRSVTVDEAARQVRLFLPSFRKDEITLTQYGPEVTIAAGDQRRNLYLPPSLNGRSVTAAKFQDSYLTLTF